MINNKEEKIIQEPKRVIDINKVRFVKGKKYNIKESEKVTVIESKKQIIIKHSINHSNNFERFKRISKTRFLDKETGEIRTYKIKRFKTEESIKNSMRRLGMLIDLNFDRYDNVLFITLTCKGFVEEVNEILEYLEKFIRILKNQYKEKFNFLYIYKLEEGKKGWHIHLLLKDTSNKILFIPNPEIQRMWEKGITYTEIVRNGFINVNYENSSLDIAEVNKSTQKIKEYMTKTTQLPPNKIPVKVKLFGGSQNVEKPKKKEMSYKQAKEIIKETNAKEVYDNTIDVKKYYNTINKHRTLKYRKPKNKGKK